MNEALVSVVIPTYNRAEVICNTVANVLEQTYSNFEVIVVDDGSTDSTLRRLAQFGDRVKVIAQPNRGPSAARNRGLKSARGEIIAFQDSDDLWIRTKLERQVALLERAGASVPCCLSNAQMLFTGKPVVTSFQLAPLRPPFDEGLFHGVVEFLATTFVLFTQAAAIRVEALKRIGGFDESLKFMEDYDLPLRLALDGNSWAFIREPLVIWRQGSPGSVSLKAVAEESNMRQCALRSLDSLMEKVKTGDRYSVLRSILGRELRTKRRELASARIGELGFPGAPSLSGMLKKIDRYRRAIYRRSPSYPWPQFEPFHPLASA